MYNIVYVSFILLDIHSRSLRLISEKSGSRGFLLKSLTRISEQLFCPPNFFCPSLNLIEKQVVYIVDSLVDICTLMLSLKENTNVDFIVLHIFACICRQVLCNKNLNSCQFVLRQCMCSIYDS